MMMSQILKTKQPYLALIVEPVFTDVIERDKALVAAAILGERFARAIASFGEVSDKSGKLPRPGFVSDSPVLEETRKDLIGVIGKGHTQLVDKVMSRFEEQLVRNVCGAKGVNY